MRFIPYIKKNCDYGVDRPLAQDAAQVNNLKVWRVYVRKNRRIEGQ